MVRPPEGDEHGRGGNLGNARKKTFFLLRCLPLVWPFSTVRFQMSPQIVCLKGCIVTLFRFFTTVCFQMSL